MISSYKKIPRYILSSLKFFTVEKNSPEKFERPWGHYENLLDAEGYKVKRITVDPDQQLSLQYHYHREEFRTVVCGSGYVTVGDDCLHAKIGHVFHIPIHETHRLRAEEKGITIIEVQLGDKCIEEDIVRLKDDYARV